ncbi:hypothetical protein ACFOEQ_24580 [Chryseobacterium arachidis]
MTGIATSTMIYVNSIANGSLGGNAVNINAEGYYYFDGTVWVKLNSGASPSINIYNADGTLTNSRIVTQGTNTLTFNPTVNNGFSVKGSVFSVDGANNRVGIGTTTPIAPLQIRTTVAGQVPVEVTQPINNLLPGIRISGTGTPAVGQTALIGFNPNESQGAYPILAGATYTSASASQGDADFIVAASQGGTAEVMLTVKNRGNVGIGTTTPQKKMHVNGGLQITNELSVGGDAATAGSSGTTGQVLTSNGAGNAPTWQTPAGANTPVRAVTSNDTLTVADSGGFVYSSGTAALTITVPDTLPIGFHCVIIQQGTAQVTVVGSGTLTLNSARGNKTRTRYSAIGVVKHAGNVGVITGDAVN